MPLEQDGFSNVSEFKNILGYLNPVTFSHFLILSD